LHAPAFRYPEQTFIATADIADETAAHLELLSRSRAWAALSTRVPADAKAASLP